MKNIEKLFLHSKLIGARLESVMDEKGMTKARLCKEAGFSRPTLDKLLDGEVNVESNFMNYMTKAMSVLSITPEKLLSDMEHPYAQVKLLRELCRKKTEELSELTGISIERLKEIENGYGATNAELRDIALLLHTGVDDLLGETTFSSHIAILDDFLDADTKSLIEPSGFWGHVGILPKGSKEYSWYPISAATRRRTHEMMDNERLVIPCMNNRLLYINTHHVKNILFLDEACDQPEFGNWDPNVSEGEVPAVVYECYDDYLEYDESENTPDAEEFSPKFWEYMKTFRNAYQWDENQAYDILHKVCIHYEDGQEICTDVYYDDHETLSVAIDESYNSNFFNEEDRIVTFRDISGVYICINTELISYMDLPLVKTQRAIHSHLEEE